MFLDDGVGSWGMQAWEKHCLRLGGGVPAGWALTVTTLWYKYTVAGEGLGTGHPLARMVALASGQVCEVNTPGPRPFQEPCLEERGASPRILPSPAPPPELAAQNPEGERRHKGSECGQSRAPPLSFCPPQDRALARPWDLKLLGDQPP